jgi:hypothetical protein
MIQLLFPMVLLLGQLQPLLIPGEHLTYDVTTSRLGRIGKAELSTTAVETATGAVIRLSFATDVKVLLFKASDRTISELDAKSLNTLRYSKRERSPIRNRNEAVVIDHAAGTWSDGKVHRPLACGSPLDELSIIFLIRSLQLQPGEEHVITRHFDQARNPIRLRALSGVSETYDVIEMTVPDQRQDSGVSVLRFFLTRDESRVPVRIESNMPIAGRTIMVLRSTP